MSKKALDLALISGGKPKKEQEQQKTTQGSQLQQGSQTKPLPKAETAPSQYIGGAQAPISILQTAAESDQHWFQWLAQNAAVPKLPAFSLPSTSLSYDMRWNTNPDLLGVLTGSSFGTKAGRTDFSPSAASPESLWQSFTPEEQALAGEIAFDGYEEDNAQMRAFAERIGGGYAPEGLARIGEAYMSERNKNADTRSTWDRMKDWFTSDTRKTEILDAAQERDRVIQADANTQKMYWDEFQSLTPTEQNMVTLHFGGRMDMTIDPAFVSLEEDYGDEELEKMYHAYVHETNARRTEATVDFGQEVAEKGGWAGALAAHTIGNIAGGALAVLTAPARWLSEIQDSEYEAGDPNFAGNLGNVFKSSVDETIKGKNTENALAALSEYDLLTSEEKDTLDQWWNDSYYEYVTDQDAADGWEKDPRQVLEEKYGREKLTAMYEAASAIREAKENGNTDSDTRSILDKASNFGYDIFSTTADSLSGGAAFGTMYRWVMGASEYQSSASAYASQGIKKGKALAQSVLNGLIETATEGKTVNRIENWFNGKIGLTGFAEAFAGEGGEEAFGALLKRFTEHFILGDDDSISQDIAHQLDDSVDIATATKNAFWRWVGQTGYEAIVGGFSGIFGAEVGQSYQAMLDAFLLNTSKHSAAVQSSSGQETSTMDASEGQNAVSPSDIAENGISSDTQTAPQSADPSAVIQSGMEGISSDTQTAPQNADPSTVIRNGISELQLGDIARTAIENGYSENSPLSAEQYVQAIHEAYQFGQKGMRASLNQGSGLTGKLDNTVRIAAYHAGKTAGDDQIAIETAKVQNRALPGPKDAGVVHYDGDRSRLSQLQQTSLSALDGLAKALGKDFHIYESTLKERVQGKANGWYDPRDGSIHIDLNAGADGKGTMLFTASHELTHYIKDWSPAKYRALSDFLFEKYGEKDISIDDLISREYYYQRQQAHNKGLSHSELYSLATEEVVAKSMKKMLTDGSVAEKLTELKQKDRSLYQKIKDCISDLAKKIRAAYQGLNPDSEEGQLVGRMQDSIDQIQQLFAEGMDDASRNEQAAKDRGAEKNTTREDGVKYALRDVNITRTFIDYGNIQNELKAIENSASDLIARKKYVEVSMSEVDTRRNEVDWSDLKAARRYLKGILKPFQSKGEMIHYNGESTEIYLTKDGLNHAAVMANTPELAATFARLKEIIAKAEYSYSSKNDPHSNINQKVGGKIDWDSFVAAIKIGNKFYPIVLKFRSIDSDVRSQLYAMAMEKEIDSTHDHG